MNFDKKRLAEVISAELKVPIIITSDGDVIDKNKELSEFNEIINLFERQFASTTLLYEDFGVDLTLFMNPIQDLNEILFKQIYGDIGYELIYQYVANREFIETGTPLKFNDVDIVDILTLFNTVNEHKKTGSGSSNRSKEQ